MGKPINRAGCFQFTVLKNGDLEIKWVYSKDSVGGYTLAERRAELTEHGYTWCFGEWFAHQWGNGWTWANPEQLGILWDGPIIGLNTRTVADKIENLVAEIKEMARPGIIEVEVSYHCDDEGQLSEAYADGTFWTYERYAIEDELEILVTSGRVIFTPVPSEDET